MISHFFIDRPVFAWVVGLIIMLIGGVAVLTLPVAQYPSVAPPQIAITVTYPGASAETVSNTVIKPIEQEMFGLDGLEYISSTAQSNGSMEIDLTFIQGTDPDIAQVQVQNKLSLAESKLPSEVTAQGISVTKAVKNFMMIIGFVSSDGSMSDKDLSDYVASNIQPSLSRVTGVGDYTQFGAEYAMRIWMDPAKLYQYSLTVGDVSDAITAQNVQVASGELGGMPATSAQKLNATIIGPSRFENVEDFENIILKITTTGSQVRLKDVARVELGSQSYSVAATYNGKAASGLALKLAAGANQLDAEAGVRAELDKLSPSFPPGMQIVYPLDTKPFITLSIEEVVKTLIEAIILVFVVMYIFLQNFRATLIPTIAVPVVLLGTFGILSVFGYLINTLTMLAMVLAVGLLVDDAIVVVENVERVMDEEKCSPREAARVSMDQITGALVGIVVVLVAVFLPMAFLSGSTGVIYRQFSITIVSAMLLSVVVALVLTPALCATLLRPRDPEKQHKKILPFRVFDRGFNATNRQYVALVSFCLRKRALSGAAFLILAGITVFTFSQLPAGFIPDEDQALLFVQVTTPPGSVAADTKVSTDAVVNYLEASEQRNVDGAFAAVGFNFGGQAQNAGFIAVKLKDWAERTDTDQSGSAIAARLIGHFANYKLAKIIAFQPPAIMELGNATGLDFELEDQGNLGHQQLLAARNVLLQKANSDPNMVAVRPNGVEDAPQYKLNIDREKANAFGVSTADINTTVQGALASSYVDQFMRNGRVKQVYIQGEAGSRMLPDDLGRWYVRNSSSEMVPFSAFMSGSWTLGIQKSESYNGNSSFEILAQAAPGRSTGQAMAAMESIAKSLPSGIGFEWTGLSYEQQKSGSQTIYLYAIALIAILFCLAALYESWSIPLAVLLVVPLGVLGAAVASLLSGQQNDVYFQVGLLTTVGLAVKNAILIVEFAKQFFDQGESLVSAALKAAEERLRPILMTSIAFVCGTLPLMFATGAGAASRVSLGTAVVGGMITATLLAVFFVPLFFEFVLKAFMVKPRLAFGSPSQ